jgi:hypothetical protein
MELEFLSGRPTKVRKLRRTQKNYDDITVIFVNWATVGPLPDPLPKSLRVISLRHTDVVKLPELPRTLKELSLTALDIEHIPLLPEGLEILHISSCYNLKTIKNFPSTLKKLRLVYCRSIREFPKIPHGVELYFEAPSVCKVPQGIKGEPNDFGEIIYKGFHPLIGTPLENIFPLKL